MAAINTHLHLAIKFSKIVSIENLNAFLLGVAYPYTLETKVTDDFYLGYNFQTWIEQYLLNVEFHEITKYDRLICDMEVILPYIEQLQQLSLVDYEQVAMNCIMALENEPMPLYMVKEDTKNTYHQMLDIMINEYIAQK